MVMSTATTNRVTIYLLRQFGAAIHIIIAIDGPIATVFA